MKTDIEILGNLAERGISIKMLSATKFSVEGFYKSNTVEVDIVEKTITARYNEVDRYSDLEKVLVGVNYYWWQSSRDRYEDWKNPHADWIELLEEHGYIKKIVKTVVEYE